MTIHVTFECDGCFAKAERPMGRRTFQSLFGNKSWGFGHHQEPTAQETAPPGWIAFDPYTGCTYCHTCWDAIENHDYAPETQEEVTSGSGQKERWEVMNEREKR